VLHFAITMIDNDFYFRWRGLRAKFSYYVGDEKSDEALVNRNR